MDAHFFFGCYAVLAYAVVNTIDLAIMFWSYWKRKRERLHYIVEDHSLRQVPPSSLLSLSVLLWFAYSAGLPQSHHSGSSLSFVWACWICFALWGARWGWGVRAITCLSSIPPLSFLSFPSASVVLFFFLYCSILFLSPQVLPSHILFKYFSLRLLRVSSNPRVVRQPEANGAVLSPVGSLRLDQGRNAVWHILIEKTWCPLLKSLVNSSSNLHIPPPPQSPARTRLTTGQDQWTFSPLSFKEIKAKGSHRDSEKPPRTHPPASSEVLPSQVWQCGRLDTAPHSLRQ